jgi:UDP-glucose 4-epimerase
MPDRALVTGGAGFIGSHLVERLLDSGYAVQVIDDLSTGRRENVKHLKGEKGFGLTVDTVLHPDVVAGLVAESDVVFHLAAAVGVHYVIANQIKSIRVNVRGTENVLQAAAEAGKKVVLFSTSEVYGKSARVPFRENDDRIFGPTTSTRWGYAVSKSLDEIMALAYAGEGGLSCVIVRCFNTCGPRQTGRYGMVLPRFVSQALAGEPITVYGNGAQTRCFASVFDVVEGVVKLAEHPDAVGGIYNIGSDREVTITRLAERVREISGSESEIRYIPYEEAYGEGFEDMLRRVPDLSRIGSLIDFEPRTGLDDIIRSVVDYHR